MSKEGIASKLSFFTLCFGAFLVWMSYGLVYPLFAVSIFHPEPIFLTDIPNALRGFWLGVMLAASPLAQFFMSPIIGTLSDQIGRKLTLQITTIIVVGGYLLSAFGIEEQNLYLLILGRIVTGIGAGNIAVINSAVADISLPSSKARNFAWITMSNGLGFTVGPFLGGKLSVWGYAVPFLIAGLLTILSLVFYTFLFIETYVKKRGGWATLRSGLHHMLKTSCLPKFRVFFPVFFIFCFGWSFYWEFIPVTWIKIYGLNVSQIGNFYAYGSAIYVLSCALLIRPIIKKFKALPILLISWAVLGICFFPLFHAKIEWYWVGIPIQQFLVALIFPVGTAVVSNAVTKNRQGEILGAFQSLQSFAFALTPFLGGVLLDLSYDVTLIVGGIAMLLACLILFLGFRKKALQDE